MHNEPLGIPSHSRPDRDNARSTLSATWDVVVIGAGLTGLSAALTLASAGARVLIVEANSVAAGASGLSGGQVLTGFAASQWVIQKEYGRDTSAQLWHFSDSARADLFTLAKREGLIIGKGVCVLSGSSSQQEELERHYETILQHSAGQYGVTLRYALPQELSRTLYSGATLDSMAFRISPVKLCKYMQQRCLAIGVTILEQCRVISIRNAEHSVVVNTCLGKAEAQVSIVACNAFSPELLRSEYAFGHRVTSWQYRFVVEPSASLRSLAAHAHSYWDTSVFRRYFSLSEDDETVDFGFGIPLPVSGDGVFLKAAERQFRRVFSNLSPRRLESSWSGPVMITRAGLPKIGCWGARTYYSFGYTGHGLALSVACGRALGQKVLGQAADYNLLSSLRHQRFWYGQKSRDLLAVATARGMAMT